MLLKILVSVIYFFEKCVVFIDSLLNFKKSNVYLYNCNGFRFYVRKKTFDKQVLWEVLGANTYPLNIRKDFIVVDFGANIGAFSVFAAKKARKVIAYEPEKENYSLLKRNLELNNCDNVVVHNLAVSDKNSSSRMYVSSVNPGRSSLLKGFDNSMKTTTVKSINLARVFKDNHLKKIDLLKVDVEGAEHLIFNDESKDFVKKIGSVELEYHNYPNSKNHKSLVKFFESNGFRVKVKPALFFDESPMGMIFAEKK